MRLAHITDTHIDGKPGSVGRLVKAIEIARSERADHLVLTGDLTAAGRMGEFVALGRILEVAWGQRPATIVRGNHDGPNFDQHMARTMGQYLPWSRPGIAVSLGAAIILPLSTFYPRRALAFRALGKAPDTGLIAEAARVDPNRPLIVAMHHGPQADPLGVFAGLTGRHHIARIVRDNPHVHVLCGHDHRVFDAGRVHIAAACVGHPDPVRIYDVVGAGLKSVHRCAPCGT